MSRRALSSREPRAPIGCLVAEQQAQVAGRLGRTAEQGQRAAAAAVTAAAVTAAAAGKLHCLKVEKNHGHAPLRNVLYREEFEIFRKVELAVAGPDHLLGR